MERDGLEPTTSRYRTRTLTTWATAPPLNFIHGLLFERKPTSRLICCCERTRTSTRRTKISYANHYITQQSILWHLVSRRNTITIMYVLWQNVKQHRGHGWIWTSALRIYDTCFYYSSTNVQLPALPGLSYMTITSLDYISRHILAWYNNTKT